MTVLVRQCTLMVSVVVACTVALARAHAQSTAPLSAADSILLTRERAQWQALKDRDTIAFAREFATGAVDIDVSGIRHTSQHSAAQYVSQCQLTEFALKDLRATRFPTATVLSYKAEIDETCWGQKAPSPIYVMSVYEQAPSGWRMIAHSETAAARW